MKVTVGLKISEFLLKLDLCNIYVESPYHILVIPRTYFDLAVTR